MNRVPKSKRHFRRFSKVDECLQALRDEVEDEAVAALEHTQKVWGRPLAERIRRGECIAGLTVSKVVSRLLYLKCPQNNSRYRKGDSLMLNRGEPEKGISITLFKEGNGELLCHFFNPPTDKILEQLKKERTGWYLDEGYADLSRYYLGAIDDLSFEQDSKASVALLLDILLLSVVVF